MTFHEYVTDWFHELVNDHKDNSDWCEDLFNQLGYNKAEYLDDDETCYDFLMAMSDENEIYEALFGYNAKVKCLDDLPDTEGFLKDMLKWVVSEEDLDKYSFCDEFVEDIVDELTEYDSPLTFFQSLQSNGCQSGMIGLLIYNSDCLNIYGRYCNDMEELREDLENETGVPIHSSRNIPRYVWLCWLCYEEFAFRIGRYLFENDF